MSDVNNRKIWLGGKIVNVNDAKINVLSPTMQFGLNVFEGVRCYYNEGKKQLYAFRLDDHIVRLKRSIKIIGIDDAYSAEQLKSAFIDTVRANEYREDIAVRQMVFVDGFGTWSSTGPVNMFISPIPKSKASAEYNKTGLNCCVSSWRRISDSSLSPRIKCGANYMNSRMAQMEALRNGYDTAIFINEAGKVSEGPGSCLFVVRDGTLITPALTDSVLESITRDTVIKLARENNIPVVERSLDRTELYICDEAFLCGSAMSITPILSVDRKPVGDGNYKISEKIYKLYHDEVCGKTARVGWVTPIYD